MIAPYTDLSPRVRQLDQALANENITFCADPKRGVIVKIRDTTHGGEVQLLLRGAHVLSATLPGQAEDIFHLSPKTAYPPEAPIRGGNPFVFPWFGSRDGYPSHGFARLLEWKPVRTYIDANGPGIALELTHEDIKQQERFAQDPEWSDKLFQVTMEITVGKEGLSQKATVRNLGAAALSFQGGFHPYFSAHNYLDVTVEGLEGLPSVNSLMAKQREEARYSPLLFAVGAIDRIHFPLDSSSAPSEVIIREGLRQLTIGQKGLPNWVTWNPGDRFAEKPGWAADIADNKLFVCVEPLYALGYVTLAPGADYDFEFTAR
jgi:D-hexose-6-phosphate mutarotase